MAATEHAQACGVHVAMVMVEGTGASPTAGVCARESRGGCSRAQGRERREWRAAEQAVAVLGLREAG